MAEAVAVLADGPRSGSPVDVATVLAVAESLRGVALAELAEMEDTGGFISSGAPSAAVWLRDLAGPALSDATARGRLRLARRLRDELPELGSMLRAGTVTLEHAQAVSSGTAGLDRQLVAESAEQLSTLARSADPGTIRAVLAERAAAVRPELAAHIAARRHERRGFYADPIMGEHVALAGGLGWEDGQTLLLGLDLELRADRQPGDGRSLPQRRADVLVQWSREAATRLAGPGDSLADTAHTVRSSLLITCTLDQLRDLTTVRPAQPAGLGGLLAGPPPASFAAGGLLAGPPPASFAAPGGTLTGEALRRLACDATLTLLVDDGHAPNGQDNDLTGRGRHGRGPGGSPLYVGRSSRTVTAGQFKALVRRDRTCVVAGCTRRPAQCEAHHVRHWADGGSTDLDNLVLLCHEHHHDHHDRGHTLRHHDGRYLTSDGWGTDPPWPDGEVCRRPG